MAVAPLFLFPYCTASTVGTVELWLSFLALVWLVMEPSRRSNEMLHDARLRVSSAIVRDPVFWLMVVLSAFAAVRWANGGVGLAYDTDTEIWSIKSPSIPALPGAVNGAGYAPFACCVALTVLVASCRHALGKAARMSFLFTSSSLAGLAALVAVCLVRAGHPGALAATKCPLTNASYVGTAFGLHFLSAIAVLPGIFECRWNKLMILLALSVGGSAVGLYFFSTFPVIALFAVGALLMLLVSVGYSGFFLGGSVAFKCVAAILIASLIPVLCVMCCSSPEIDGARLGVLKGDSFVLFSEKFLQVRDILSSVSAKVWEEHAWLGTGLGSFPLELRFNAAPSDWSVLVPGQSTTLNGWWMLLVERGICGALAIGLVLLLMGWTFIRRLIGAIGESCFIPACCLGPLALVVLVAETFVDTSFLRPEVLMAQAAFLALAASFFPPLREKAKAGTKVAKAESR